MFYYFGRKKSTAKNYPAPTHDSIVEPFAGSAAYSLHGDNWQKKVLLIDNNPLVASLWQYLLSASPSDILSLPMLEVGDNLDNFNSLSPPEKALIGLHINPGSSVPKKTSTRFSRWKPGRKYIADNIFKIKHWSFIHGDYSCTPKGLVADYFIDPPYFNQGKQYAGGNKGLDYGSLSLWVKSLSGQIMVCEGEEHSNWLPFQELDFVVNNGGTNGSKKSKEYLYYRNTK